MSFDPLIKALEENPALAEELGNAKTPRERDAILDAHGIEKPTLDSQFPDAAGGVFLLSVANALMVQEQRRRAADAAGWVGVPPGGAWIPPNER
jgi:hypothetical protein